MLIYIFVAATRGRSSSEDLTWVVLFNVAVCLAESYLYAIRKISAASNCALLAKNSLPFLNEYQTANELNETNQKEQTSNH